MGDKIRHRESFSPAQLRAARGLLGWSRDQLADKTAIEVEAISIYERGEAEMDMHDRLHLGRTLNLSGVIALSGELAGEGVRFNFNKASGRAQPRTAFAGADDFGDDE